MKRKLVKEHPGHFEMSDGQSTFKIAKKGTEDIHEKIRKMADGGTVKPTNYGFSVDDLQPDSASTMANAMPTPLVANVAPPQPMGPTYAPALLPPTPAFVPPSAMEDQPGFDKAAYENAKNGQFPSRGPEAYQSTRRAADEIDKEDATRKAAADLGIRPLGSQTQPEATTSMPTPIRQGGGSGGPATLPGMKEYDAGVQAEQNALKARGSAEAEQARARAAALAEGSNILAANHLEQKRITDEAGQASADAVSRAQKATDDMKNIDTTVDPGRFWASKSTGQRISGIIGLVLGAFGTGPDGINKAAQMMTQAVDRDIDAQKAEHALKMQKGRAAVESAQSMYGMQHQIFGDKLAATAAARASALDIVSNKIQQAMAATEDPIQKAKLAETGALIQQKAAIQKRDTANMAFDNQTQRITALRSGAGGGAGPKMLDQKQRDQLNQVESLHQIIQDNGAKLKALIQGNGTAELTGPAEAKMRQYTSNIAVAQAKMNDPSSAARPGEVEIEENNLFKPGFMQNQNTALQTIDSYLANSKKKRDVNYQTLGLEVPK